MSHIMQADGGAAAQGHEEGYVFQGDSQGELIHFEAHGDTVTFCRNQSPFGYHIREQLLESLPVG